MATRAKKTAATESAPSVVKKTAQRTAAPRKRAPVKSKVAAADSAVAAVAAVETPVAVAAALTVAPELRRRMIEEAAYARFVARGYVHGYSVVDWLEAEADVDRLLAGG
jgi:hypothetical protein